MWCREKHPILHVFVSFHPGPQPEDRVLFCALAISSVLSLSQPLILLSVSTENGRKFKVKTVLGKRIKNQEEIQNSVPSLLKSTGSCSTSSLWGTDHNQTQGHYLLCPDFKKVTAVK